MFQIFLKENDIFLTFTLKFPCFRLQKGHFQPSYILLLTSDYSFTFTPAMNVALGIT